MKYLDASLNDGEVLIYRARLSRGWFWSRAVLGVLLLPVAGLGVMVWLLMAVRIHSTEIGVTSQRVVCKIGLFRRAINEVPLRKIESVLVVQGILSRLVGSGTLRVRGTGETNLLLESVEAPLDVRRAILQAAEELYDKQPAPPRTIR